VSFIRTNLTIADSKGADAMLSGRGMNEAEMSANWESELLKSGEMEAAHATVISPCWRTQQTAKPGLEKAKARFENGEQDYETVPIIVDVSLLQYALDYWSPADGNSCFENRSHPMRQAIQALRTCTEQTKGSICRR
jgi:hypothetical protein